ncbi:MAG: hypothetical protein ACYDCO_02360 [Armatimonadota bacterium]
MARRSTASSNWCSFTSLPSFCWVLKAPFWKRQVPTHTSTVTPPPSLI